MAHVEVEVEVRIPNPEWMVEAERYLTYAAAQRLKQVQPLLELALPGGVRVIVRPRGPLEHRQPRHMPVLRGGLEVQERGVEPGQLLHVSVSCPWKCSYRPS